MSSDDVAAAGEDAPAGSVRRARRSTADIRSRLLSAAGEMFAEQGYSRTSTKSIAERADVAEVLLFRHYGGKANLFREALYLPVVAALQQLLTDDRLAEMPDDPQAAARVIVERVHGMFAGRRGALVALAGAHTYTAEVQAVLDEHEHPLAHLFTELERAVMRFSVVEDYTGLFPAAVARAVIASSLATVAFGPWLPMHDSHPADGSADDESVDELATLLHHGVLHRPV